MSMLLGLVISVMACSFGSGVALISARLTTLDLAFLVYHKTGTGLSTMLAFDMANVLNISLLTYPNTPEPGQCYSNAIAVYDKGGDYDKNYDKEIQNCPRMRAVHIVRRPTSAFVSDYVYEKNLDPHETDYTQWWHKLRADDFREHSLSAGVQSNCQLWFTNALWPGVGGEIANMVETHQYIHLHGPPHILEVNFEDFGSNYDKTTRSIFEHFLGNNDPRIDPLVELAAKHDLGRQPKSQVDSNTHVSDTSEEADVLMEVKRQYLAGDPCIKKLVESDQLAGYGSLTETW